MNSVEMTNNPSKKDDVVVPTSSLPQEFSFNSSKNMKLTNHLRRFKFFGGAVMAIVMLVLLATVHSSAGLKAARANAPISLGQTDSDLVLNTKTAPTITLWSQEAETESTDDEEAEDEVVASSTTLLTVVDGSNYAPIWRSIVTRTNRFAVFRRSAVNAGKIDVVLGSWNSLISDFQSQFPTTGEAVGFFVLGDKSITSLYEVVYLPSTSKLTASQVLISYGLPVDPKILNAPGLPVANTIVVKNWKDITTTNLIMNAKAAGTVSLWWGDEEESESSDDAPSEEESNEVTVVPDSSANLLAVADGSAYASVWKTLVARTNRFAVFRRNAANPSKLDVRVGTWNALVSDFQSQFPANEESVGFFILGDKTATALYEVVFLPSTSKLTASQVLAAYGLPANPKLLNAPGLPIANTLVVRNLKDITTTNFIMNAKAAGTVSLWWGEEESESSDDDAEVEGETNEATPVADSSASLISVADGSAYAAVWRNLVSRASRFAVFRRSTTNPQKLDVRLGAWSSTLLDFKSQFPTSEPAVGFFILGDKSSTGLYEVVFNPSASKLTASKVLASFALPVNPKTLNAPGLPVANTLVVKNLYDITTSNLVLNAKAAGTISLWWGKEEESDVEEVETAASEAGSEVADSSAALLAVADGSAYASVWKTLVARTNRFAVFRRNAANPSKLDVRVGTWNALVSDFQSQFPANEESVGFFILGDKTATALYEVVFLPSTSKLTAAQVLAAYGLPANPKLLNAPGLPIANTLVVRNLKDITTTNFILNAKPAGTVSLWWGEEESESSDDDAEEGETAETAESGVQSLWGWSSSSSSSPASDGSAYEDVWAALKAKTNRFVVFRQNAANNKLIDVDSGNWDATFPQFSSLFQATKPQVGYIWLGTPNHEQLYEIVYCPVALRTNPATVMVNFGLPPNPNVLVNSYGLALPNTFVATEKKQVDTGNVIMKAVSGGIIP